jgi:thiosulfate dehydrogenase (quinone) large subunit
MATPATSLRYADVEQIGTGSLSRSARLVAATLRVVLGWTFLWAFLDKLFGLGYATPGDRAWLNGGSTTRGFLENSAAGPFQGVYTNIAGDGWADWLFMLGLLGIGIALTLGIAMRIAAISAAVLYVLMWTVALPPVNNPIVDEHLIGALASLLVAFIGAGHWFGLGDWWDRLSIVRRYPVLR